MKTPTSLKVTSEPSGEGGVIHISLKIPSSAQACFPLPPHWIGSSSEGSKRWMGEAPFRGFPTYRFLAPPLTLSVQKNGKCAEKDKCHWTVRGPTEGLGTADKWMIVTLLG